MKKFIYLLFALFMLSMVSCNYATGIIQTNAKGNTMTEDLMAKENKSLVQEKEYTSKDAHWTVKLTSKFEDTRTKEDLIIDAPKKIYAVNRVIFNGLAMDSKSFKGMPYAQYFDIKKIIKEDIGGIDFILKVKICTLHIYKKLSEMSPLRILFADKQRILTIDDVEIIYQETDEPQYGGTGGKSNIKDTIIRANIPLDIINQLRTAQSGITIRLKTIDDDSFEIILPPIFIEYLREF